MYAVSKPRCEKNQRTSEPKSRQPPLRIVHLFLSVLHVPIYHLFLTVPLTTGRAVYNSSFTLFAAALTLLAILSTPLLAASYPSTTLPEACAAYSSNLARALSIASRTLA